MDSTFLCGLGIQRQLENSQAEEMEETGRCCADQWDQTTWLHPTTVLEEDFNSTCRIKKKKSILLKIIFKIFLHVDTYLVLHG